MRAFLYSMLASAVVLCSSPNAFSQFNEAEAKSLGLEVAWRSGVKMPAFGRGVASAQLWVSKKDPTQYAVVELPNHTFRVSAKKLDKKGQPIGIEAAVEEAKTLAAQYLGKPDGITVQQISVPDVFLVVVEENGLVQTFDAESGKLLWSSPCGSVRSPAHPAALCPEGIALVHGTNFYLLDWATGKHLMSKPTRSKTSNAVAVSNGVAFVPDFNGRVATYGLREPQRPWQHVIQGRSVGKPVSSADMNFCAIASEDGYVYIFNQNKQPSVWIRYEAASGLSGSLAAANSAFYVGTSGGSIAKFSLATRLGRVDWEHRTGAPITAVPFIVGSSVFVATEAGGLMKLADDDGGRTQWIDRTTHVHSVLGATQDKLFCRRQSGSIAAYDRETGRMLGETSPKTHAISIVNQTSNRIYHLNTDGYLTCLRPIASELPTLITPFVPAEPEEEEGQQPVIQESNTGGGNIFGPAAGGDAGENIFGGTDPFGGGAGGNAGDGGADPFGDDPFGGNGGF